MRGIEMNDKLRNLMLENAGYDLDVEDVIGDVEIENSEKEEVSEAEGDEVMCCPLCEHELSEGITNDQLSENFNDIVDFINSELITEDEE